MFDVLICLPMVILLYYDFLVQCNKYFSLMYSFFLGKPVALQGISLTLLIDGTGIGYEIFISPTLLANIRI